MQPSLDRRLTPQTPLAAERLPGALHILDKNNVLSPPLQEITSVAAGQEIVLLDVAVDPQFRRNHRIFFTFCDFIRQPSQNNTNTYVARARLDGDKLSDVKVIFRGVPQWPAPLRGQRHLEPVDEPREQKRDRRLGAAELAQRDQDQEARLAILHAP